MVSYLAIFPRLRPARLGDGRFLFQQYLRNREYQALLGFLAALAILVLKIHLT